MTDKGELPRMAYKAFQWVMIHFPEKDQRNLPLPDPLTDYDHLPQIYKDAFQSATVAVIVEIEQRQQIALHPEIYGVDT